MLGTLKIKSLFLGMLLLSPAVGVWALDRTPVTEEPLMEEEHSFGGMMSLPVEATQIPVEVISKGRAPEWVYVEVDTHAVPEPGILPLLLLAGAVAAFRRQRA